MIGFVFTDDTPESHPIRHYRLILIICNFQSKTICTILERSNVSVSKRKKTEFSTEGLYQDLNRLLLFEEDQIKDSKSLQETKLQEACACLNAVIKYLELTSDQNNFEKFRFTRLDSNRFVHLDSAAMNALLVLPKKEGMMKNQSIFGLLDRCRTSHGKRYNISC